MTEEEFKKYVNRMNENIGNLLKDNNEELAFYFQLVARFNDVCDEKEKQKEVIDKAIKRIKYYKNNCGYDGQTCIYDIHLDKLLSILGGEEEVQE